MSSATPPRPDARMRLLRPPRPGLTKQTDELLHGVALAHELDESPREIPTQHLVFARLVCS
jgi:hypothetical protein